MFLTLTIEPLDVTKVFEPVLIAGLLKLFFMELPQPLVPQNLYRDFVDLQGMHPQDARNMQN